MLYEQLGRGLAGMGGDSASGVGSASGAGYRPRSGSGVGSGSGARLDSAGLGSAGPKSILSNNMLMEISGGAGAPEQQTGEQRAAKRSRSMQLIKKSGSTQELGAGRKMAAPLGTVARKQPKALEKSKTTEEEKMVEKLKHDRMVGGYEQKKDAETGTVFKSRPENQEAKGSEFLKVKMKEDAEVGEMEQKFKKHPAKRGNRTKMVELLTPASDAGSTAGDEY